MHRSIPVGNRLCAKRTDERKREVHKQKLSEIKCQIDFAEPASYQFDHLRQNLKREQMLEERYEEIDRHNRILLQKMAGIMRKPLQASTGGPKTRGTLNKALRTRELHRITEQNQGLLQRIQRTAPTYNHVDMEEAARKQESYLKHACEYDVIIRGGGKTPRSRGNTPRTPRTGTNSARGSSRPRTQEALRAQTAPDAAQAGQAPGQPRRVFMDSRTIVPDSTPWLIEMRVVDQSLLITAYNQRAEPEAKGEGDAKAEGEGEEDAKAEGEGDATEVTHELVLEQKDYRRVFRESGGDYNEVARRLGIVDDKLVIKQLPGPSVSAPAALLTYADMTAQQETSSEQQGDTQEVQSSRRESQPP